MEATTLRTTTLRHNAIHVDYTYVTCPEIQLKRAKTVRYTTNK
jgi:hypothetical protein